MLIGASLRQGMSPFMELADLLPAWLAAHEDRSGQEAAV